MDDQAFLSLIDYFARKDQDYPALKKVLTLSFSNMVIKMSVCSICARQAQTSRSLTRFENLIFTFAKEQDHLKKESPQRDLKSLLVGFMKQRRGYGLHVFEDKGWHPHSV